MIKPKNKSKNKKGYLFILGICVLAVAAALTSFITGQIKEKTLRDMALNPHIYTEPENKPASNVRENVRKEPESAGNAATINTLKEEAPSAPDTSPAPEAPAEFKIMRPVNGEIIKEFSGDNLVFSNTFQDYRVHKGIDIMCERSTAVKAVADGVVEDIYADPMEGIVIVINHNNNYKSVYKNLSSDKMVQKGEMIAKEQTISGVGETAIFESADEPHLHFELMQGDLYVNPTEYFE